MDYTPSEIIDWDTWCEDIMAVCGANRVVALRWMDKRGTGLEEESLNIQLTG